MTPHGKTMTYFKFALQLMNLNKSEVPSQIIMSSKKIVVDLVLSLSIVSLKMIEMSSQLLACATPCVRHACFLNVLVVNMRNVCQSFDLLIAFLLTFYSG